MTEISKLSLLPGILSLSIAAALFPLSAAAQDMDEQAGDASAENEEMVLEEVMVTGFRRSLMESLNAKRESADVIDTITALDIGKFPDSNIAESLQRITGVSIDRDAGEGRFVTIRGLGPSFNLATFNGRVVASDTPSRSFSYDTLAPEIIRAVDVYKTQNASLTEGAIGGLVDIRTAKPFDFKGRRIVGTVKAQYNDSSGEWGPWASIVFSDRFNEGNTGLLLSLNYNKSTETVNSVNNFQWVPAGQDTGDAGVVPTATELKRFPGPVWWAAPVRPTQVRETDTYRPQSLNRRSDEVERERGTINAVFQHAFSDNLTVTADALYSEFEVNSNGTSAGNWFWNPVTNYDFERNDEELLQRYFDSIPGWVGWVPYETAEDHALYHAYPTVPAHVVDENGTLVTMAHGGNGMASETFRDIRDTDMMVLGFNTDWQINDKLYFNGDVFYSSAHDDDKGRQRIVTLESEGATSWVAYDLSQGGPVPQILNFSSEDVVPEEFLIAQVQQQGQDISAENIGLKLDFAWDFDRAGTLKFGAQFASNEKENQLYEEDPVFQDVYKLNTQGFNALGPNSANFVRIPLSATTDDLYDFVTPGSLGLGMGIDDNTLFINDVDEYLAHITSEEQIRAIEAANDPDVMRAWLDMQGYEGMDLWEAFNTAGGFNPQKTPDSYKVVEDTRALYFNHEFDFQLGSVPVFGMVGLRYVETDITSSGTIRVLEDATFTFPKPSEGPDDPGIPGTGTPIYADNGAYQAVAFKDTYDNWLPNINFNFNLTENLIARLAWSQSLARPELEDIAPWIRYGNNFAGVSGLEDTNGNGIVDQEELDAAGVNGIGRGSNTELQPYLSTNIDFSLEWYYGDNSALTFAYFDKEVDDWITGETASERVPLASYPDGVEFFINRPRNIDKADINGWELNWQHYFDFGLGWQANYSSIDSNAVLDLDSNFSLEGLSDTYNIVVFYETDRFMIRVAHNWRENFLQNLQDPSSNLEFPEPQYVDDYEQWDMSASYRINDKLRILLEGINLTDEGTMKHGRYSNHFLEYIETGPRYRIGLRGTF